MIGSSKICDPIFTFDHAKMDHQHQWSHTNIGNISGLWYQGYKPGVKEGHWNVFFFVDLCDTIHKTNTGHDTCRIECRDNISSEENHMFDVG